MPRRRGERSLAVEVELDPPHEPEGAGGRLQQALGVWYRLGILRLPAIRRLEPWQ